MLSPITVLVLINCLPLYFILAFGWDAGELIRIYWAENLVVGFYYILKLICVKLDDPAMNMGKFFLVPFFLVHFGGFCAVHGIFVFALTSGTEGIDQFMNSVSFSQWPGPLIFVGLLVNVITHFFRNASPGELLMVKMLFISHGFSFYMNFIKSGEWKAQAPKDLMAAPYQRIMLLHIVILAGAAPVMYLRSPVPLVVLLVVIKVVMDIRLHKASHEKIQKQQEAPASH